MSKTKPADSETPAKLEPLPICGIVMPISEIDGCNETHWLEVRNIIFDAVREAGFVPQMVSDSDDVGIIQKRIVQNLYDNPIVVCDVSCKNPNVMFELGMRLAFDRPTIILKDEKTDYSFDTSLIEHLTYPRDLRFAKIVDFKEKLQIKVKQTFETARKNPDYSTFLKSFGKFTVAKIDTQEVPTNEYILEELKTIRELVANANRGSKTYAELLLKEDFYTYTFSLLVEEPHGISVIINEIEYNLPPLKCSFKTLGSNRYLLTIKSPQRVDSSFLVDFIVGVANAKVLSQL